MHLRKLLHFFLFTFAITALRLTGAPAPVTPVAIDSVEMQEYRRIWGSPSGCFYFLKRSGFEVHRFGQNTTLEQTLNPNQKLISSENGNFFALITYSSFSPTALHVTEVRLFNYTGQLVWGRRDPGCNSFILSDKAPIAVGIAGAEGLPETSLLFFGASGDEVGGARVDNFSNGRFSDDGAFFFAISGGAGLVKFTSGGKELYRYSDCNRYGIGRDGAMVALLKDASLAIYSGQRMLWSLGIPELTAREVRFSSDNRLAAILLTRRLQLLDLDSLRVIWEYALPDSDFQFFHFDTDSSFTYFACSTNNSTDAPERRNTRGQAILLDSDGRPVWQTEMNYADWSVKYPEVKIDINARILTLLTAERFRVYSF
jgi:hypothetical protein